MGIGGHAPMLSHRVEAVSADGLVEADDGGPVVPLHGHRAGHPTREDPAGHEADDGDGPTIAVVDTSPTASMPSVRIAATVLNTTANRTAAPKVSRRISICRVYRTVAPAC